MLFWVHNVTRMMREDFPIIRLYMRIAEFAKEFSMSAKIALNHLHKYLSFRLHM